MVQKRTTNGSQTGGTPSTDARLAHCRRLRLAQAVVAGGAGGRVGVGEAVARGRGAEREPVGEVGQCEPAPASAVVVTTCARAGAAVNRTAIVKRRRKWFSLLATQCAQRRIRFAHSPSAKLPSTRVGASWRQLWERRHPCRRVRVRPSDRAGRDAGAPRCRLPPASAPKLSFKNSVKMHPTRVPRRVWNGFAGGSPPECFQRK